MKRRAFTAPLAGCAGATFGATGAAPAPAPAKLPGTAVKPPRLMKGDKVGLVALAGPLRHAADLDVAKRQAAALGVRLVLGDHLHDHDGYLAGSDATRADDFNRFARDPTVRAIFSLRGGYGTMRILDRIDYGALKRDPKIVLGFSDLTALLNAITLRTGLITFHGPVAGHAVPDRTVAGIRNALMSKDALGALRVPAIGTLSRGKARAPLVGGNLSIVAALVGTPYAVPCAGNILMLEDVREAPYRIDRMLTQLTLSGDLGSVAGIALGSFRDCVPRADDDQPSWTIDETLRDRLVALKKPMITRLPAGHVEEQWTLPLGMNVSFDGDAGTLTVEEPAVR
ncbi:MAG: LD-carboxypeptidase [Candidatus Eremiobacteraeota bacterium]|nr:LD-carboxypeptidase [Candidatus Eremiobacteraeota bacterium]